MQTRNKGKEKRSRHYPQFNVPKAAAVGKKQVAFGQLYSTPAGEFNQYKRGLYNSLTS